MRARLAVVVVFLAGLGATYWMYRTVPQALIPPEDPGYFITVVQAPAGRIAANTRRTSRARPSRS